MPLKYELKDTEAPLAGLEVTQTDMLRLHTGIDRKIRGTGIQVNWIVSLQ